jgi:hypothetical protein
VAVVVIAVVADQVVFSVCLFVIAVIVSLV